MDPREASAPPTPHLDIERLCFTYTAGSGTSFDLRDVSSRISRGSITGLLGPNGSGKSTMLRLIAGILTPTSGTVRLDGRSIGSFPRREAARRIALVPQGTHPAFDYTALEMVLMGRHPHLGMFEVEGPDDIHIAYDAMRATSTDGFAQRSFLTLSGGEQQRVALASALAQAPDLLLLDEPTASLDLGFQFDVTRLLRQINVERGVTMILATHDLNFAATLCDHVVMLRDGRVVAQGPVADTLTAANIGLLYHVDVDVVIYGSPGRRMVVPTERLDP